MARSTNRVLASTRRAVRKVGCTSANSKSLSSRPALAAANSAVDLSSSFADAHSDPRQAMPPRNVTAPSAGETSSSPMPNPKMNTIEVITGPISRITAEVTVLALVTKSRMAPSFSEVSRASGHESTAPGALLWISRMTAMPRSSPLWAAKMSTPQLQATNSSNSASHGNAAPGSAENSAPNSG